MEEIKYKRLELSDIENIIIEGVDYLLIRTIADCDKITIYYNN